MPEKTFTGTIIRWFPERGFGFVRANTNDRNYFMHIRSWMHEDFPPVVGQSVEFELAQDQWNPDKPKAVNVHVIAVAAGLETLKADV
jgi:cold shock CspA family protein